MMKPAGPKAEPFRETMARRKNPGQPAWLGQLRDAGLASFEQQGFPTLKDEDWRFTNVAPIAALPFKPTPEVPDSEHISGRIALIPFTLLDGPRLVFVNGRFSRDHSTLHGLPPGVRVQSLSEALEPIPACWKSTSGNTPGSRAIVLPLSTRRSLKTAPFSGFLGTFTSPSPSNSSLFPPPCMRVKPAIPATS